MAIATAIGSEEAAANVAESNAAANVAESNAAATVTEDKIQRRCYIAKSDS
jgi:hypothetical protein